MRKITACRFMSVDDSTYVMKFELADGRVTLLREYLNFTGDRHVDRPSRT